jgi:hypothetical protein
MTIRKVCDGVVSFRKRLGRRWAFRMRGVRPHLAEVLADLAHAQTSVKVLEEVIVATMEDGYRPMYRGHEWTREHFIAIEAASKAMGMAWELMKWVQFPEMESRLEAAAQYLSDLTASQKDPATTITIARMANQTLPLVTRPTRAPAPSARRIVG